MKKGIFRSQLRRATLCALLLIGIVYLSPRNLQGQSPEVAFAQAVEESKAKMNAKYPDLNKPGTPLYEFVVVSKRLAQEKNLDLFKYPRWPEVIVESCVQNLAEYQRKQAEEAQRRQAAAYQEQQDIENERQNSALLAAQALALRKHAQRQTAQQTVREASDHTLAETWQDAKSVNPNTHSLGVNAGSVNPNAYGLGVNSDEFGRPHSYRTQDGQELSPILQDGVTRNAYGLGVHSDGFGRPVYDGHP